MTGIRVFLLFTSAWVVLPLGHASFLDKMDCADREAELGEQAEKDLEFLESEWKPQMEEAEEALTDPSAKTSEFGEDEFARAQAQAAIEIAEMTPKAPRGQGCSAKAARGPYRGPRAGGAYAHGLDSCTRARPWWVSS